MQQELQISNKIENLIREGISYNKIMKLVKISPATLTFYRNKLNLPSSRVIIKLNNNPEFENEFNKIYNENSLDDIVELLKIHPLFSSIASKFKYRPNQDSWKKRIFQLRNFYRLPYKMYEHKYESDYDRIRGYIIRNTKFMAKRRGVYFDLKYTDFELPEICPLLNIKLTYLKESDGNCLTHASMDRIDNNKGYIKGNVIILSKLANQMKNCANFEQLETFSINSLKLINHYKNQDALGEITDVFPNIKLKT